MDHPTESKAHIADVEKRLLSNYERSVSEFELLLMILRGDTTAKVAALAHSMLKIFGSLGTIISADLDALRAVDGMTEKRIARLRLVQFSALRWVNPAGRSSVKH